MSASVVSLSTVRQNVGYRRWSNQDIAEIYRVADTLRRAGLPVDCDKGQTDEGDPWYAFCNANTGDVIVHFACIDGRYVAEVCHLGVSLCGDTLGDIVGQFLRSYPVILPNNHDRATRVWMHPASGLVAFIATLYFLLEMSQSAQARAFSSPDGIDGSGIDEDASSQPDFHDNLAVFLNHNREQAARTSRSDGTTTDGGRAVAVSAAILIAGVLMDWHRSSDKPISFEPASILDAIQSQSGDDLAEAVILALKSMAGFETAADGSNSQSGDASAVRTGHLARADSELEIVDGEVGDGVKLDGDDGLVIDIDGEFGESGRAIGAELVIDGEIGPEADAAQKALARGADGQGRLVDTIAASVSDNEKSGAAEDGEGQESSPSSYLDVDTTASAVDPGFLDAAPENSTVTLLQSLGLETNASDTIYETVVDSLSQLIAKPSDTIGLSSNSSLTGSGGIASGSTPTISAPAGSLDPVALSPTPDVTQAPTPLVPPSIADVAKVLGQDSVGAPSTPSSQSTTTGVVVPAVSDPDFSIFDPVDVLQLFVQNVEKVGFAHLEEVYYLYDAVTFASAPEQLEFEQVHLENGDEVNLLGQAATFDAIYEALA